MTRLRLPYDHSLAGQADLDAFPVSSPQKQLVQRLYQYSDLLVVAGLDGVFAGGQGGHGAPVHRVELDGWPFPFGGDGYTVERQ